VTVTAPNAAWSYVAANYLKNIVPGFRPASRSLCEALRIGSGDRVLDVGCGPGTTTLEAVRLGAGHVTGVDFSPEMVALARKELAGHGRVDFLEGDAASLPVLSEAYDVGMSAFGIIFSPDPRRAMGELHRAVVAGGRAGMLAWARGGTTAVYYERIYHHIQRLDARHDPYDWGVREKMQRWFGEWFGYLEFRTIEVPFVAASPTAAWEVMRTSTGRVAMAYEKMDAPSRARMDAEMIDYFQAFVQTDGSLRWPREALMVTGTK
jgi:SAM-dependent methyltransferase